jgi:hypothetical protein
LYIESEVVELESRKLLGVIGCGVFEERNGMWTVAVERALQYNTEYISISWSSCSSRGYGAGSGCQLSRSARDLLAVGPHVVLDYALSLK